MASLIFLLGMLIGFIGSASGEPLVFKASASGHQTLDQGEGGGNPFASSLIEILRQGEVRLADLPEKLRALTIKKSQGYQTPDVPEIAEGRDWRLVPRISEEKRMALVLVVSNYDRSGAASLPGAAHDAQRVGAALSKVGFETELALNFDLQGMREKLKAFEVASSRYDVAAIYTTGHGVEFSGAVYLVPGDFPLSQGDSALPSHALALSEIAKAARAQKVNLVFYGACRNDPLAE
jgi:uncharacterized caspase-like protein